MDEMKLYMGAELIKATPMTRRTYDELDGAEVKCTGMDISELGYLVEYSTGHHSWSPKETFEEAYRLVSDTEKAMIG